MALITGLGRCIVTCLNIFFVIISLLMIAAGVIAYQASEIDQIQSLEKDIRTALDTIASKTGSGSTGAESFSITEFLDGIGMGLIIAGCVLLFLSFLGCCGACCKFKTLIFVYALIISVMLLGEIIVVILMYAAPGTAVMFQWHHLLKFALPMFIVTFWILMNMIYVSLIQGSIKDVLLESLKNYKGIGNSEVATLGWMFVMQQMKCCGVNDYKDFSQTKTDDWRKPGGNVVNDLDAPVVCCVNVPTGTSDTDFNCAREATLDINNEGCFDKVWDSVLGNPTYAAIGYSAAFVFQLLLIIFSYLMYVKDKKKGNKVYPRA